RPLVWVPLAGVGDADCIGVLGARGFSSGFTVADESWRKWCAVRMAPVEGGDPLEAKQVRLIRQRALPEQGRVGDIPAGTASKVVYGHIARVTRKRVLLFTIKWEDGLVQADLPLSDMHGIISEDDNSSGKQMTLSPEIVEYLHWVGSMVGPVLDNVRKTVHITRLKGVQTDLRTRTRELMAAALATLLECVPSLKATEVWQADNRGMIRCIGSMDTELWAGIEGEAGAARAYRRPNARVDHLLHPDDVEAFFNCIEEGLVAENDAEGGGEGADCRDKCKRGGGSCVMNGKSKELLDRGDKEEEYRRILTLSKTPEIISALFNDVKFKVGNSWFGADRHSKGFALVLRQFFVDDGCVLSGMASGAVSGTGESKPRREDCRFAARVAQAIESALACLRGREHRIQTRKISRRQISNLCEGTKFSGRESLPALLEEISATLPGCRVYVGSLMLGGNTICYEAATPNSNMCGRLLQRGQGVSFSCLDPLESLVVQYHAPGPPTSHAPPACDPHPQLTVDSKWHGEYGMSVNGGKLKAGDIVEVWYSSKWLCGAVIRDRGREYYDVIYEGFCDIEAGVPRWRLRRLITLEHLRVERFSPKANNTIDLNHKGDEGDGKEGDDSWPWPYVCVPIRFGSNRLGVLGVDGWGNIGLDDPVTGSHPERPVLQFLEEVGEVLGKAIFAERRERAKGTLSAVLSGRDATNDGVIETLVVLLREVITFCTEVHILETHSREPGTVFSRAEWKAAISTNDGDMAESIRREDGVFEGPELPRDESLSVFPDQVSHLYNEGKHSSTNIVIKGLGMTPIEESLMTKLTTYQREVHHIAKGELRAVGRGYVATTLVSRPWEIIGRLQRLTPRKGGGRPASDGCYLVRVVRNLPDAHPKRNLVRGGRAPGTPSVAGGGKSNRKIVEGEDVGLVSELCSQLEIGFMRIAGCEQRTEIRRKAIGEITTCCQDFADQATGLILTAVGGMGTALGEEYLPVVEYSANVTAAVAKVETGGDLAFSAPMRTPTPAETCDGQKGVLVRIKDGRLGVLVEKGEKRVAIVEMQGGKQQYLPESEVSPGQTILLWGSHSTCLLMESTEGGNAVLINERGKAALISEDGRNNRRNLPLTMLKDIKGAVAQVLGEGSKGVVAKDAAHLMKQVVASIHWAIPQVNIYCGFLSKFGASLHYEECRGQSLAQGCHLYRHSIANGG
ncbi:unnamed protein product, partial [Choristocarpus tenellus]